MSASKLNVQFNEKQAKALSDIAEELGTTKAGVLKTALSLLELATNRPSELKATDVTQSLWRRAVHRRLPDSRS